MTRHYLAIDFDCTTDSATFLTTEEEHNSVNTVSSAVWHGRAIRFLMPELNDEEALLEEVRPLAEELTELVSIEWNGSNHVGVISDRGEFDRISEEIMLLIDSHDNEEEVVQRWEASDWFAGMGNRERQAAGLGIAADMSDEQLRERVYAEIERAEENDAVLDSADVERHFRGLRDDARDAASSELDAYELGRDAAEKNPTQELSVAAEAAIPAWVSDRSAEIERFIDGALEYLDELRAENPNAIRV